MKSSFLVDVPQTKIILIRKKNVKERVWVTRAKVVKSFERCGFSFLTGIIMKSRLSNLV